MAHPGVRGLDAIVGGGLPKYSFNLIAGGPGAGKTTLAQQIVFANATVERPALYFTVLGEPALKMLRHVQQYSFLDRDKLNSPVRFVNSSTEVIAQALGKLLERITDDITSIQPAIVVVDSFRTITRADTSESDLQERVHRLALHLTSWEATTFLVGEYQLSETHNPIFTVADGVIWMSQTLVGRRRAASAWRPHDSGRQARPNELRHVVTKCQIVAAAQIASAAVASRRTTSIPMMPKTKR